MGSAASTFVFGDKVKPGRKGQESWARVATLMAGRGRGTWFMPEVGDEVLVAFEGGDATKPYVLGALWNTSNPPPAKMDSTNSRKLIRSRNGVTVSIEDVNGGESVSIATPGGQHLTLRDGPGTIEIQDSNGNSIELGTTGVRITCAASVSIAAAKWMSPREWSRSTPACRSSVASSSAIRWSRTRS